MATTHAILPDTPICDPADVPAKATDATPMSCPGPVDRSTGCPIDAPPDDDEPELRDVGPDGFPEWYDDYERWSARMSLFYARRGPLPE